MTAEAGSRPRPLTVASWLIYDLANTIFALGVVGLYFSDWLVANDLSDSYLAAVLVGAAAVVIFLAPWAGARSDVTGTRIPILVVTTVVAVIATAALALGPVWLTLTMLWLAVIAVNTGSVVYDALLVDVSTPQNRGHISGLGVGVGYLGSFLGLGIGLVTLEFLGWDHDATFRTIAVAFLLFALPAFLFIDERGVPAPGSVPGLADIARRIVSSWRTAGRHPGVVRFLMGRFLYTDAINTLIGGFLAIFVIDELGLDRRFFAALMGVAISAAVVGGLAAGPVISRRGPLRVLRWVLVMWVAAIASGIMAAVTGVIALAWLIGPLGGLALGATWASDRVVMTRISPPLHLGEFYGLYATVGRFATIAGPLVWAVIVDGVGAPRTAAMAVLGGFVLAGWWILRKVDDAERDWQAEGAGLPPPSQ
ncbi:MAG: MFS transporter [Acidimicrobiia bacterium]